MMQMKEKLSGWLNPMGDGWPKDGLPGIGENRLMVSADELAQRMTRFRGWRRSLVHFPSDNAPALHKATVAMALEAVRYAIDHPLDLDEHVRFLDDAEYYDRYPGEHYRLLAGFCHALKPKRIVEIGTFTGMSSRVFVDHTDPDCEIVTFDIMPWTAFASHLTEKDFTSGRVQQILEDLSDDQVFRQYADLLSSADLVFVDGPKDGNFEGAFFKKLASLAFKPGTVMLVDDIKFENMVLVFDDIAFPKLDLTSFGHWSGTGVVELAPPLA